MTFRIVTPRRLTLSQNKDQFLWPSMLRCPLLREAEAEGESSAVCLFCQDVACHVPLRVHDVHKQHTIVVILRSSCDRVSAYHNMEGII